jgi:N-dimethylarginine dimethylaminohydrolase
MCPPEHFTVEYAINPWMDTEVAVDAGLALQQWDTLRTTLTDLGHLVHVLDARPGLPDMVYSANGAFSVDGTVYGARFKYPQRADEAVAHQAFYTTGAQWRFVAPEQVNEGEGDFAYLPGAYGGIVLAGYGFRTDPAAHAEAQEILGVPVVSLQLVDPRYYHLDTALCVLDDRTVAYLPDAFSPGSRAVLRRLFPDAVIATPADAAVLGLNAVSDGETVVLPVQATALTAALQERGYQTIGVDVSELRKAGGGPKCCTLEVRG